MISIVLHGTQDDGIKSQPYSIWMPIAEGDFNKLIPVKTPNNFYLRSIAARQRMEDMHGDITRDYVSIRLYRNGKEMLSLPLSYSNYNNFELAMQVNDTLEVIVDDLPVRVNEWRKSISKYLTEVRPDAALNLYDHRDEINAQETPEAKRMMIGMLVAATEVEHGKNRD